MIVAGLALIMLAQASGGVPSDSAKFADSLNLRTLGKWTAGQQVHYVTFDGKFAYVSTLSKEIYAIDLSDPSDPIEMGSISCGNIPVGLAVKGKYLFAAVGNRGLCCIDISDPMIPEELSCADTPDSAIIVDISGKYAYVADGDSGIRVIDISDPNNLHEVGHYDTKGFARSVKVKGKYAYVADGPEGLVILNVSNPKNPVFVNSIKLGAFANAVEVDRKHAYVAIGKKGVVVVDVSNPHKLEITGHWTGPGAALGVRIVGNKLCIGAATGGVRLMDLSAQREIARFRPPDYTRDYVFEVILANNNLLAASRSGLLVYQLLH